MIGYVEPTSFVDGMFNKSGVKSIFTINPFLMKTSRYFLWALLYKYYIRFIFLECKPYFSSFLIDICIYNLVNL